jgi:predicted dehydrogenase
MSQVQPLRVALVGCGLWGRHVLRDLRAQACDVVVVARSRASTERAHAGGAVEIVTALTALSRIDAAIVATPTDTHYAVVSALIQYLPALPIFVEKPLCNRTSDGEALFSAAPERVFVMDKWRYHAGVLALAHLARSGEFGRVVALRTRRFSWGTIHDDSNTVWHLAPHDLAITLEILGTLPAPVAARIDRTHGQVRGMTALLGHDPWVQVEVSDRFERHHREIRLHLEDAVAVLGSADADHLKIFRSANLTGGASAVPELRHFALNMPLYEEIKAFIDYVRGGAVAPKSSCAEGLAIVRTIAQLFELAKQ